MVRKAAPKSDRVQSFRLRELLVLAAIGLVCLMVFYVGPLIRDWHYFSHLSIEARSYYTPQLQLFGLDTANVALQQCQQQTGYVNDPSVSKTITCSVSVNMRQQTSLDADQAKAAFQKLETLAKAQHFTDASIVYSKDSTINFAAIAPDKNCSVKAAYSIDNTVTYRPGNKAIIAYQLDCQKKSLKVFSGYPLTQNPGTPFSEYKGY